MGYATHAIVGNLSDFQNLDFLIPDPYPDNFWLPKTLVFHDNINECTAAMSIDSSAASAKHCKAILKIGRYEKKGKKGKTREHTISGSFILFFSFAMVVYAMVERTFKRDSASSRWGEIVQFLMNSGVIAASSSAFWTLFISCVITSQNRLAVASCHIQVRSLLLPRPLKRTVSRILCSLLCRIPFNNMNIQVFLHPEFRGLNQRG